MPDLVIDVKAHGEVLASLRKAELGYQKLVHCTLSSLMFEYSSNKAKVKTDVLSNLCLAITILECEVEEAIKHTRIDDDGAVSCKVVVGGVNQYDIGLYKAIVWKCGMLSNMPISTNSMCGVVSIGKTHYSVNPTTITVDISDINNPTFHTDIFDAEDGIPDTLHLSDMSLLIDHDE